jgi:hypothetical protein
MPIRQAKLGQRIAFPATRDQSLTPLRLAADHRFCSSGSSVYKTIGKSPVGGGWHWQRVASVAQQQVAAATSAAAHAHSAAAHAHAHERTSAGYPNRYDFTGHAYRIRIPSRRQVGALPQGRTSRRAKALSFRVRVPSLWDCVRVPSLWDCVRVPSLWDCGRVRVPRVGGATGNKLPLPPGATPLRVGGLEISLEAGFQPKRLKAAWHHD